MVKGAIKYLVKFVMSVMSFIIIGGLLYAGLFIKPKAVGTGVEPPIIGNRDIFYGLATPTSSVIWAVGSYGKVVRSDNAGKTWAVQPVPRKIHLQGIAAWDDKRAIIAGNEGIVMVTRDGGKSWTQVKTPLEEVVENRSEVKTAGGLTLGVTEAMGEKEGAATEVAKKIVVVKTFADGSAWAVGEMGAVLYSKDFGSTWERALPVEDVGYNDICFVGQRGWLVGEFGRLMGTDDGGKTWKRLTCPVETSLMSVAFKDEKYGVVVGLEGVVIATRDGGKHWVKVPEATTEHLFSVIWDGAQWVAVGDKSVFLKGDPFGGVWKSSRLSEVDLSWHTQIIRMGDRYYAAGPTLGMLEGGKWKIFGQTKYAKSEGVE